MKDIALNAPDDWHAHVRYGDMLKAVMEWSAKQFRRIVAMGNVPPIETVRQAVAYDQECNAESKKYGCTTLVSPKLTMETTPELVLDFCVAGFRHLKLYWGITTGSSGIVNIEALYPCFAAMQDLDMVLQIHAEDPRPTVDCDQRERTCLPQVEKIASNFPKLRIVIEHISCAETVDFVRKMWQQKRRVGATVTLHHIKHHKNDVRGGFLDPHLICKPEIQGFADLKAIQTLVFHDRLPNVFHGSDTAPHPMSNKGPGLVHSGVFSAPVLMPEWLRLFKQHSNVEALKDFTWAFGADFYKLPRNKERLIMLGKPWQVPAMVGEVRPYMAEETLPYQVGHFI